MVMRKNFLIRTSVLMVIGLIVFGPAPHSFAQQQDANEQEDLFEMSIEQLMNVEVTTASKRSEEIYDAPGVISVITQDEIKMFGARNLLDILNRMPSVYTSGSYLFPLNVSSIRGDMLSHIDNHTLVLINSRPVRESLTGGANYPIYSTYPIEMIDRIELVRGPGSVLYGTNAYTGVINIITKHGDKSELTLTSEAGSFGYYSNRIAGGTNRGEFSFYGALSQLNEDGWHFRAKDEAGIHNSMSRRQSSGSLATHMDYGDMTFDLFWSRQDICHFGRAPLWSLSDHQLDTERLFADIGYTFRLMENWRVVPHITFNYSDFTFEGDTQKRKSIDVLGEITLFGAPTDNLNIVTGYIIEHQAGPQMDRSSIKGYSRVPLSAYSQVDYQPLNWMTFFTGLQWNKPEDGESDFITRVGTIVDFTPNWGIKLLRGEAFRAPWPIETSVSNPVLTGNPDLNPEEITTYNAQLFYHDQKSRYSMTYFRSTMEDLISRVSSGGGFTFANGGEMHFSGLEFEGKRYLNPKFYALGSITYQESEEDPGINPSLVPNTMGKFGLGYENEAMSVGLFYNYFSTPPSISGAAIVNPTPGDIHWLSANLNLDVTDWFDLRKGTATLTFRVENLLDEDVYHPEFNRRNINSLPGDSGLALYAGIRLRF